jgi:FMN phosphatase YigB (HAD superfamily)
VIPVINARGIVRRIPFHFLVRKDTGCQPCWFETRWTGVAPSIIFAMRQSAVRAVVFDVGNTLWFEATSPDRAAIERLQAERVRPLIDVWGVVLSAPLEQVLGEIWDAYIVADEVERETGRYREPSLPFIIRGALASHDVEITDEQAEAWWRAAWISGPEFGIQLYPDTLDVLRELRDSGVTIGVSSTRPCTADMFAPGLGEMGLTPYVNAVVCSGDTGYRKPHRSTFDLVLGRLGVGAGDAVMVGDLADADVAGGKAVGMTTVWKLNGRHDVRPCADADYVIHDLAELLSLPMFARDARPIVSAESLTPHEDGNAGRY